MQIKAIKSENMANQRPFPANICWSSRRLQDVLKTCLEDVLKMPSRHVLKAS